MKITMNIKEILQKSVKILMAKKISSASLDAELLLLYALNQSKNKPKSFRNDRAWLYAHNDYKLTKNQEKKFHNFIERRKLFEPIAYITGKKEFYGLEFCIDKNVLVPRPETELLVEESLKDISAKSVTNKKIKIADIGTGSGAIAITLAKNLKDFKKNDRVKIYATDISPKALKISKINEKKIIGEKDKIFFRQGDLWKALPENIKFDFVLANLPYLSAPSAGSIKEYLKIKKITPVGFKTLSYEPKIALTDNNNGISLIKKLIISATPHLNNGTRIFMESDPGQIPTIKKLAKKYLPPHEIEIFKDLRGFNRVTKIKII